VGPIETLLLNYDALTPAERDEADAHLAAHPQADTLVAEGRALRALLEQVAHAGADVPNPEAVAQYVVAQYMARGPLPPDLAVLGRRVEAAIRTHPQVERQYSIMQDRLRALTDHAASPRAHFERLVGYSLDAAPGADTPMAPPMTAAAAPDPAPHDLRHPWRSSPGGAPPALRRVVPRLLLAASLLLALAYGGLLLASNAKQTDLERLANLGAVPAEYEGLRLRGMDGIMDPAADRYAAALDRLNDARSTTLGLFPRYDEAGLDSTLLLLREVAALDDPDAALGLEAWFLIGRILLHQGEVEAARSALRLVVERQGPSTPDARRLLDALPPERIVSMAVPRPAA
jgi:hypothetical protein